MKHKSSHCSRVNAFYGMKISCCIREFAIWLFVPPYFPIFKFHGKWPLQSATWSYRINVICLSAINLTKSWRVSKFPRFKARGGVKGQKLDFLYFFIVKSSTLDGIVTFYRMKISTTFYRLAKSSLMRKIWRVKFRGYYLVIYKIQEGNMTKNDHFRSIFSKVLVS